MPKPMVEKLSWVGIALTMSQSPYTVVAQKWKKTGTWTSWVMVLASLPIQLEAKPSKRRRLVWLSIEIQPVVPGDQLSPYHQEFVSFEVAVSDGLDVGGIDQFVISAIVINVERAELTAAGLPRIIRVCELSTLVNPSRLPPWSSVVFWPRMQQSWARKP